jgi:outer membrane receptor protein involved in Fe transport
MRTLRLFVGLWLLLAAGVLHATIFGSVKGIVHDPQHRPIAGGQVTIRALSSQWSASAVSGEDGAFHFNALPIGTYEITVSAPGFATVTQRVAVSSGSSPILHFPLAIAGASTTIEVGGQPDMIDTESSSARITVTGKQVAQTPGADRTNSMAMITDYVPGAYVVHDQLHVRGGHQVEWLIDGVPVPNTNIATNVGPQFDPKDIEVLEVQRGGYSAEYGDRTYGVFNVVTRSGFERDNGGELIVSYGSFHQTDDQISFGSHTQRFAYYASLSGNRADLGLETPTPDVIHDIEAGASAFSSLIWNKTPSDQLRLVTSLRGDHFQVPNTSEQQIAGVRDVEDERDAFANFTWLHSWTNALLTISPFYHFNRAHYVGRCTIDDVCAPAIPDSNRASNYVGGVATMALTKGKHNAHIGLQGFAQHDNSVLALKAAGVGLQQRDLLWGSVETLFLEDQFKATSWLTLNGGVRLTAFSGGLNESAADPRIGVVVNVPRLKWVLRGFYGRYYQPPPLLSVSGPILDLAVQQGFGFLPLHGERDEQSEVGLSIPIRKWVADFSYFRTNARNFLDHDVLGNSNIFFPLTLSRARIRGFEATLRSPELFRRATLNLVYSRQTAQAMGGVTGGLTDFAPPEAGWFFLDHDQRHTLNAVLHVDLPQKAWVSSTVGYGSGFLNGDGPSHLPAYTVLDLAVGKSFGEAVSLQVTALNVANHRYLIDNSNTFGGTHWANPREVAVQMKYRFHY